MMVKREVCSNFMADNCSCFVLCLLSNVWGLLPALCLGWLLVVVGGGGEPWCVENRTQGSCI